MTPRVFIPQEPVKRSDGGAKIMDLSPAERFGRLVHVFPSGRQPLDPGTSLPIINRAFADYTERDFILPIGAPALIAWCAIAASRRTPKITMLAWSRDFGWYIPITAHLDHYLSPITGEPA